jgi:tRNA pseudouridine38-40 synthase
MRYFLELSYDGTNYKGWQRQRSAPSVQQTVEEALSRLLGGQIEVTGAGRTDTGVHAACYVAHFDVSEPIADGAGFIYHANSILPPDIAIGGVRRVADDAHARYDAREREYTYYITTRKNAFLQRAAWYYSVPLDVEAMNVAAAKLLTTSDFTTFAKLGGGNKTNLCRLTKAIWEGGSATPSTTMAAISPCGVEPGVHDGLLVFTIRADRFLRNMVRAIVGTLVDVGRGKITPAQFARIVDARDLSLSSGGAPAHGLFLTNITY